MIKNHYSRKTVALFFIFTFLNSLLPYNALYANNNGPNAPEAAAFEPVDATDMVNLVTGGFSYVLPLLNIPSPEGGYPLALSYHAGIAMDQEASWVGLGWSLNPGAINRGVNGYPDDWGKTNFSEFFYDKGWENNYYSFSAGVTLYGAYSIGLGVSWGSNQSLGGYVSASIGLGGENGASIGGYIGTNGVGITGGYGVWNASLGTDGVGLGYGIKGNVNLGVSLNYNYSSGLSGGVSVTQKTGEYTKGIAKGGSKHSGMGISFSSSGMSMNAKVNGVGAGISTSGGSVDAGDYDVTVTSSGFFLPIYVFYIGYNHNNVKYSLFKYNDLYTSGTLYPVHANNQKLYNNTSNLSRLLKESHFMDVNIVQPFYQNSLFKDLVEDKNKNDRNNLVFPNYDNYSVNAQGLSGAIAPYTPADLILSGRGRGEQNKDNEYVSYLNYDISEYQAAPSSGIENGPGYEAIRKKHFAFTGAYNSFLRIEKTNILQKPYLPSVHSDYIMKFFNTNNTNKFNNYNSLNSSTKQKREGNSIVTYTNKEIRQGSIFGFIEAKEGANLLSRNNKKTFLDEGIGAFKITTLDGKTYHYSLPVYQFESYYKNFKNKSDEYKNFFEIEKSTPYATHWLLTAITGPDYVDTNNNKKVDKNDYGYWVEFDYGKWSDGYIWQTPNGRYEENIDIKNSNNKTYSYSWGSKQLYYLDCIRTRTHTALFVKDLRKDNLSISKDKKKLLVNYGNETFNPEKHSESFYSATKVSTPFYTPQDQPYIREYAYNPDKQELILYEYRVMEQQFYSKSVRYYIDIKPTKTLSLSKIIICNNKNNQELVSLKNNSNLIQTKHNHYSKVNYKHTSKLRTLTLNTLFLDQSDIKYAPYGQYRVGNLFGAEITPTSELYLKKITAQFSNNILDVKDIEGLGLEEKADQVIDFQYDYSLANGAPNTPSGRLTLKKVHFKGKGGNQLVPPYEFAYGANYTYNKDQIDDWGYNKNNAAAWSLNKITTPTGGNIKINYESDVYSTGAAYSEEVVFSDITSTSNSGTKIRVNFADGSPSPTSHFTTGLYYKISYDYTTWEEDPYDERFYQDTRKLEDRYKVSAIGSNWVEFETETTSSNLHLYGSSENCAESNYERDDCVSRLKVYGSSNGASTSNVGGGIRTKSITVNNGVKDIATTEYIYSDGITSYAPTKEQIGVPYRSELPAPMVLYGEVEMRTKDGKGKHLGKTVYNFETLKPRQQEEGYIFSLGECFRVKENQNTTFENGKVIANKYTIESKLGNIGRINRIRSYNSLGQLMSQTKNKYKQNLDGDGEIGVTQETHSSYKRLFKNNVEKFYVSSTSKIDYPSVLESVEQTSGGLTVTKHFDKHDFLTGQVLESRTYASDGKAFKTKIVPAYTIPAYTKMGSKVDDTTNKNMLSQVAAEYNYVYKNGNWQPVGVGMTTWNNNWTYKFNNNSTASTNDVWRKHKTYTWNGSINTDGTYNGFVDDFNWTIDATQNSKWKKLSEVTRYDQFSQPLEMIDINKNYASTKMGDDYSKVIATSNTNYDEMYYSGAEYLAKESSAYFDGGVKSLGRKLLQGQAHTGDYIVEVGAGANAFEVSIPARSNRNTKFKVSVWAKKGQHTNTRIKVGSTTKTFNTSESIPAGDWVLLNGYIDVPTTGTTVAITSASGTIQLDDFRLHPVASSMMSYVYNQWDEVSYIIGANGLYTHYVYDDAGRLESVWQEVIDNTSAGITGGKKKIKEYKYTYKKFVEMDTNGNGQIDTDELYPRLSLSAWVYNENYGYKIKAYPGGGSGDFEYRWAVSTSATTLNYGSWTSNKEYPIFLNCGERKYYKCQVKDKVTGATKEYQGSYLRDCTNDGNDPIKPIE